MNYFGDLIETPYGTLFSVVEEGGALILLTFCSDREEAEALFTKERRGANLIWSSEPHAGVKAQLDEYFRGERTQFTLSLNPKGTEFQHKVWRALCEIPYGTTMTYGQLAAQLGSPNASRAVGRANATNPIAIVVPCHRVIGKSGSLTGYAFGINRKQSLLDLEGHQKPT
jgi:methylated-DNA-[protein]-cysteine S-methyltransferase